MVENDVQAHTGLINFALTVADSSLIMSQRLAEWTGHGPALEQDIAMTNIALDHLGQARYCYQHIAALKGGGATEDSIAYLRDANGYRNYLLVELPNGDWAQTLVKIFLFAVWQKEMYGQLLQCSDEQMAAIAEKSLKEVSYHVSWSSEWIIRFGDGTAESNKRVRDAIDYLWSYKGELFEDNNDSLSEVDHSALKINWQQTVEAVFATATIAMPAGNGFHTGGTKGIHTEYLGYILAEMQWLQRVYPGSSW